MMKYDKELYRHWVMPIIKNRRKERPDESPARAIINLSIQTPCPIIPLHELFLEIEFNEDVKNNLEKLRRFYK